MEQSVREGIARRRSIDRGTAKRRYERQKQGRNTLPGAFAIMMQRIEDKTPEEFAAYESVNAEDISRLITFLMDALDKSAA